MTDEDPRDQNISLQFTPFACYMIAQQCPHLVRLGVGGIDKNSTSVFLEKILRYYYIPTIGVADLQAPLNNMMRSS